MKSRIRSRPTRFSRSARAHPSRPEVSPFAARCYEALTSVPKGKVTTYQLIAKALGSKAVRAVGSAMARNPFAPRIPCHRVVRTDGSIGQYAGGHRKKVRMLTQEGIRIVGGRVQDLSKVVVKPRATRNSPSKRWRSAESPD
jgi:methylated-DNA-[protein]-cysteine S-methyltransferase